ncbi:MAG TPA: hypothetical protein VIV84_03710 [Burkholderiaceae bacterium]
MTALQGALPTLTEVIEIEASALVPATGLAPLPPESVPLELLPPMPADKAAALTTQVLETLRPRIDALLESRLQAVMAPRLARLADEFVESLRDDLSRVMQELVAQAVDDILAKRRKP